MAIEFLKQAAEIVGEKHLLIGADTARFSTDWKKSYHWEPLAVARPASTLEVSALVKLAADAGIAIVPVGGHTGLNAGTYAQGALMLSLDRMNKIEKVRPDSRVAIVEAGVVLSDLHDAVGAHDLAFPLTFGARGSAMIGGCLSTNAGGSNVLRYGNTRAMTLGVEVVLADGRILDLMSELHKDNTGYDLKDLFVGAEGTLGIITRAVLKLVARPRAYATAMVSCTSISAALALLNRLQTDTGGMVEACEYMPRNWLDALALKKPEMKPPLGHDRDHTLMIELGATAPRDCVTGDDGSLPVTGLLEDALADLIQEGLADDAIVAQNEKQRQDIWAMREASGEIVFSFPNFVDCDVSLPLQAIEPFMDEAESRRIKLDPNSDLHVVSHLGDGNIHYTILPSSSDPKLHEDLREMVEEVARGFRGSFSAEHGIGLAKKGGMARRKDPVALAVMRQIKMALDPNAILNPGKVLPDD